MVDARQPTRFQDLSLSVQNRTQARLAIHPACSSDVFNLFAFGTAAFDLRQRAVGGVCEYELEKQSWGDPPGQGRRSDLLRLSTIRRWVIFWLKLRDPFTSGDCLPRWRRSDADATSPRVAEIAAAQDAACGRVAQGGIKIQFGNAECHPRVDAGQRGRSRES